jgi:hypothetical protein
MKFSDQKEKSLDWNRKEIEKKYERNRKEIEKK